MVRSFGMCKRAEALPELHAHESRDMDTELIEPQFRET